jgi:arylsulfatase B
VCKTASGSDTNITDLWYNGNGARGKNNSWSCSQKNQAPGCLYEDEIFVEEVLARIAAHDPSTPFYLFWAPHIAHAPLEVPTAYLNKFSFINDSERQYYAAMINFVDDLIGRVVAALKAKGMWDDLLWVSSADNGGPIYNSGAAGANNWPKRGGKMSNWQGGINVNAYASGGLLPAAVRGQKFDGLMHGADIYSTYCALAGVDPTDTRAAAAGLPPIDGYNMWPWLSGANATSPRMEVPVASDATEANLTKEFGNGTVVQAIINADGWKLMIGATGQNIWTGPQYPNKSTSWDDVPYHCGVPAYGNNPVVGKGGCLFNIATDPTEHNDVALQNPDIVAELMTRILSWQKTSFTPNRGAVSPKACTAALDQWGGFWGPFTN